MSRVSGKDSSGEDHRLGWDGNHGIHRIHGKGFYQTQYYHPLFSYFFVGFIGGYFHKTIDNKTMRTYGRWENSLVIHCLVNLDLVAALPRCVLLWLIPVSGIPSSPAFAFFCKFGSVPAATG